jgi:outer membrane protein assembly factor BamD
VLGINEFQEFLQFYPTNARADYAQYKMGLAHYRQMRAAERDQTETRAAVKDFQTFVDRYPNSRLLPEVKEKLREARDRLDTADYNIGYYYFKVKWYPGSIDRFKALLKQDPEFTRRDGVYFYLGESLIKVKKQAEALPYYDKLVQEFEKSEFLPEAQKRIAELKAQMASK